MKKGFETKWIKFEVDFFHDQGRRREIFFRSNCMLMTDNIDLDEIEWRDKRVQNKTLS